MSFDYRRIASVFFIFALLFIFMWSCANQTPPPAQNDDSNNKPLTVFVAKPIIQDVTLTCEVVGCVTPWKTVQVSSESAGRVDSLHFEKGDRVEQGSILAVIDQSKAKAFYDQAKAQYDIAVSSHEKMMALTRPQELAIAETQLQQAKDQYQEAEKTYKRLKALLGSGDIRQSEFDAAQTVYNVTNRAVLTAEKQVELARIGARQEDLAGSAARVAQAEASLRLAKEQLDDSRITAPLKGIITNKFIEAGEIARPGSPIAVVVDMSRVKIATRIPELDAARIQTNYPVEVRIDALPGQIFYGRLSFLSVAADDASHSFPAEVAVENPEDLLRAGMICRLNFVQEIRPGALLVEGDALYVRDNKRGVFGIQDDRAVFKPIRTGAIIGNLFIVESGIERDEMLITSAPDGLVDGQEVTIGETVKRP